MRSRVWRSVDQSPWASSRATTPYRESRRRERATSPPGGRRGVEPLRRRGPGDDRAERVRGHEPDPEEPPERRQNLGRPEAGAAREILGEGRTAELEMQEHVLRLGVDLRGCDRAL